MMLLTNELNSVKRVNTHGLFWFIHRYAHHLINRRGEHRSCDLTTCTAYIQEIRVIRLSMVQAGLEKLIMRFPEHRKFSHYYI